MNLNIFSPGKEVEKNFEKPDIPIALVIAIVPAIIAAIGYLVDGLTIDWAGFAIGHIAKRYILLVVLAALVFAVGMIFNRKNSKGMLKGIVSSLGLVYVFGIIIAIFSQIFQRIIFTPTTMAKITEISNLPTMQETAINAKIAFETGLKGINWPLFILAIIIMGIIYLWMFFVLYKIISFSTKEKPWINLACLAAIIFICGIASGF